MVRSNSKYSRSSENDDQSKTIPLIPHIKNSKWEAIKADEERDITVFQLREEIFNSALDIAYNKYLDKQAIKFTVHCSYVAYKKLVNWYFQPRDPGEKPGETSEEMKKPTNMSNSAHKDCAAADDQLDGKIKGRVSQFESIDKATSKIFESKSKTDIEVEKETDDISLSEEDSNNQEDIHEVGEMFDIEPDTSPVDTWASHCIPIHKMIPKLSSLTPSKDVYTEAKSSFKDNQELGGLVAQQTVLEDVSDSKNISIVKFSARNVKQRTHSFTKIPAYVGHSTTVSSQHPNGVPSLIDLTRRESCELPIPVQVQTRHFPSARVEVKYSLAPGTRGYFSKKAPATKTIRMKQIKPKVIKKPESK